jgi:hypothetical protein
VELKEFEAKIVEASDLLHGTYAGVTYYNGVCIALGDKLGEVFAKVFRPKDAERAYWLGDLAFGPLFLRKNFLKAFELYCIQTEAYKEF